MHIAFAVFFGGRYVADLLDKMSWMIGDDPGYLICQHTHLHDVGSNTCTKVGSNATNRLVMQMQKLLR